MTSASTARSPNDTFAAGLRGFGPLGLLAVGLVLAGNFLFTPLSAVLVFAWAWRSGTPWREIGFVRPKSWAGTIALGLAFGFSFKLLLKAFVMPLLGAPPTNQAFHFLVGNTAALPEMLYLVIVSAGFGEEIVFRGYLFERFGKLFGVSAGAKVASVALSAGWFGLAHYSFQGMPGVVQATIVGLVFGTIFALRGQLWLLIVAHSAFDLTALAIIYWDLETRIAHLVF